MSKTRKTRLWFHFSLTMGLLLGNLAVQFFSETGVELQQIVQYSVIVIVLMLIYTVINEKFIQKRKDK